MNAYEIYDGAFDNAQSQWIENTFEYIESYAKNGLEVYPSDETIQKILACRLAWLDAIENGNSFGSSNDFYYIVEEPLQAIEV